MLDFIKSVLRLPLKTDHLGRHLAATHPSGVHVLFVTEGGSLQSLDRKRAVGGSVVDADYLMTSQDDVEAVYYLASVPSQFCARNSFFIGLGVIRQYHVLSGKVRPIYKH
jgi:hypothetical protein